MADRAFFCRIPSSCHRQYSGTSCFTTSTGNSGCCPNQEAILTPNGYSCCDMWLPISFMMPSCNRTPLRWRHNGHDSISIYSHITSPTIVYSTVYSNADQRKHQSSASLAFVRGIHPHKWPQSRGKCFHLMMSSCICYECDLNITLCRIYVIYISKCGININTIHAQLQ